MSAIRQWLFCMLLTGCIGLGGCNTISDKLGELDRVDPHTMAAYSGDQPEKDAERLQARAASPSAGCAPMQRPDNDHNSEAINLDCYRFPEDTEEQLAGSGSRPRPVNRLGTASETTTTTVTTKNSTTSTTTTTRAPDAQARLPLAAGQAADTQDVAPTAYALAVADTSKTYFRNRLASTLIKQSDDVCNLELGRMVARSQTIDTSLSVAASGLSGASAIVAGPLAKSILAGLGAFSNTARESVDAGVYHNQVIQAVTQAIENERSNLRQKINAKYILSQTEWNMDDAIRDINEYHEQCSFYRGLELVVTAVSKTAPSASTPSQDAMTLLTSQNALLSLQVEYWRTKALLASEKPGSQHDLLSKNLAVLEAAMIAKQTATPQPPAPAYPAALDTSTPAGPALTPLTLPGAPAAKSGADGS